MSGTAKTDVSLTGGARGGNLTLAEAMCSSKPAIAATAKAIHTYKDQPGALLPILHHIQDSLGYVPEDCVGLIADNLQRSRAEVYGVLAFYPYFRQESVSDIVVGVCRAEACQARGAHTLIQHIQTRLKCGFHEHTSDGAIRLEPVYCLGLCAQGPALEVNGERYVHMTDLRFDVILEQAQLLMDKRGEL